MHGTYRNVKKREGLSPEVREGCTERIGTYRPEITSGTGGGAGVAAGALSAMFVVRGGP